MVLADYLDVGDAVGMGFLYLEDGLHEFGREVSQVYLSGRLLSEAGDKAGGGVRGVLFLILALSLLFLLLGFAVVNKLDKFGEVPSFNVAELISQ